MAVATFPKLTDFSQDALIRLADEHDDEAFALAFGEHPAMRKEPGFYEILTGMKDPFANMAFGMHVPNAEVRVKAITSRLRELDVPGYFWVGPCTTPVELSGILVQNGWKHIASPPAMVVDLEVIKEPSLPIGFRHHQVKSDNDLVVWQGAVSRGFKLDSEIAKMFTIVNPTLTRFYIAYIKDEIVGTSAMIFHKGVPGIYCVSAFPEFRGQGVGTAITSLPLIDARNEGYRMATLQASKMGYSIYRSLGFFEVCTIKMFAFGLP